MASAAATIAAPFQSPAMTRVGWALSGLAILFLATDLGMKFAMLQPVIETMHDLGWPNDRGTIHTLAIILTLATILYALPQTALLGAILLTGYLGGAVATHVRIGSPLFSHVLFGVYIGILAWAGLWLRDPRLRALLPVAN